MRVIVCCLIGLAFLGIGQGAAQAPEPAEIEERTEAVSKTLRCVVCQNQSIHDSNAPLAQDMRTLVRKRVEAGDSDAEVRAYLRERYGDYVLMRPPLQTNTLVLWLGPFILVLVAAGWFVVRAKRRGSDTGEGAAETGRSMSEADKARVQKALAGQEDETAI
ncbi:MAG: cytochrome c-type biogenesis protein CcmH [Henriciella sp.]